MDAEAEGEVAVGVAEEVEVVGIVEDRLVPGQPARRQRSVRLRRFARLRREFAYGSVTMIWPDMAGWCIVQ